MCHFACLLTVLSCIQPLLHVSDCCVVHVIHTYLNKVNVTMKKQFRGRYVASAILNCIWDWSKKYVTDRNVSTVLSVPCCCRRHCTQKPATCPRLVSDNGCLTATRHDPVLIVSYLASHRLNILIIRQQHLANQKYYLPLRNKFRAFFYRCLLWWCALREQSKIYFCFKI